MPIPYISMQIKQQRANEHRAATPPAGAPCPDTCVSATHTRPSCTPANAPCRNVCVDGIRGAYKRHLPNDPVRSRRAKRRASNAP